MNRKVTPVRWDQRCIALLVNSGPLSVTDRLRPGAIQQDLIQESADAFPGDRGIDDLPDAFPAVVVHDVQHAESAPRGQLIGDEVHRPSVGLTPSRIGIRTRSRANRRLRRFRLSWSFSSR